MDLAGRKTDQVLVIKRRKKGKKLMANSKKG
jgi:hypothetical protein